jgi:hypothetical protein
MDFADRLEKCSEVARLDYRRRMDQVGATAMVMRPLWNRIAETSSRIKKLESSKQRAVGVGLMILGALLHWALEGSEGAILTVWIWVLCTGVVVYASWVIDDLDARREMERLQARQEAGLLHWLSSGANERHFWGMRDLMRELDSNELSSSPDAQDKEKTLKDEIDELWWGISRWLLNKVSDDPLS